MHFCFATTFSDPAELGPLATTAEDHGWHALAVSDHVVNPVTTRSTYPYTTDGSRRWGMGTPWPDPWVTIAFLAGMTSTLRFFTNIYVMPARPPVAVAKLVGTAAVLSGNRVALGIGMGWMEEEFEAMEQPFAGRGRRFWEVGKAVPRNRFAGLWSDAPASWPGRPGGADPHGVRPSQPKRPAQPTPASDTPLQETRPTTYHTAATGGAPIPSGPSGNMCSYRACNGRLT